MFPITLREWSAGPYALRILSNKKKQLPVTRFLDLLCKQQPISKTFISIKAVPTIVPIIISNPGKSLKLLSSELGAV